MTCRFGFTGKPRSLDPRWLNAPSPITFMKEESHLGMERVGLKRTSTLLLLLFVASLIPPHASAQALPGVQIDCDDKNPELDVHPLSDASASITCTVTNPSSFEETITVENEWDSPIVSMLLSEDSFTLAAGEEEDFTVTFDGQTRLSSTESWEFSLNATVTNVGALPVPEALATSAAVEGDLTIAMYGMVDLQITDTSTRTLGEGEETTISAKVLNNGNGEDRVWIEISNLAELESLGFTFPGGGRVAQTVDEGGVSPTVDVVVRSPSDIAVGERYELVLTASSDNDMEAQESEVTIPIQLEAASESNGLGGGLEEFSNDDIALYGGIGAAVLFGFFLILAFARLLRRKGNAQPMVDLPVELPDDDLDLDDDDEFDFDDLDNVDEAEDFDDIFSDL